MGAIKQKVALEGVRFYAYHGYYPEEQKVGNEFFLDLETEMVVDENLSDDLLQTLNYEQLFELAAREMKTPRKLIETVGQQILVSIRRQFPHLEKVVVRIRKSNLPVRGQVKNALIELTYQK
jgi:7,8-dihydroneopterin aldolase/epimerase/oxygenase